MQVGSPWATSSGAEMYFRVAVLVQMMLLDPVVRIFCVSARKPKYTPFHTGPLVAPSNVEPSRIGNPAHVFHQKWTLQCPAVVT